MQLEWKPAKDLAAWPACSGLLQEAQSVHLRLQEALGQGESIKAALASLACGSAKREGEEDSEDEELAELRLFVNDVIAKAAAPFRAGRLKATTTRAHSRSTACPDKIPALAATRAAGTDFQSIRLVKPSTRDGIFETDGAAEGQDCLLPDFQNEERNKCRDGPAGKAEITSVKADGEEGHAGDSEHMPLHRHFRLSLQRYLQERMSGPQDERLLNPVDAAVHVRSEGKRRSKSPAERQLESLESGNVSRRLHESCSPSILYRPGTLPRAGGMQQAELPVLPTDKPPASDTDPAPSGYLPAAVERIPRAQRALCTEAALRLPLCELETATVSEVTTQASKWPETLVASALRPNEPHKAVEAAGSAHNPSEPQQVGMFCNPSGTCMHAQPAKRVQPPQTWTQTSRTNASAAMPSRGPERMWNSTKPAGTACVDSQLPCQEGAQPASLQAAQARSGAASMTSAAQEIYQPQLSFRSTSAVQQAHSRGQFNTWPGNDIHHPSGEDLRPRAYACDDRAALHVLHSQAGIAETTAAGDTHAARGHQGLQQLLNDVRSSAFRSLSPSLPRKEPHLVSEILEQTMQREDRSCSHHIPHLLDSATVSVGPDGLESLSEAAPITPPVNLTHHCAANVGENSFVPESCSPGAADNPRTELASKAQLATSVESAHQRRSSLPLAVTAQSLRSLSTQHQESCCHTAAIGRLQSGISQPDNAMSSVHLLASRSRARAESKDGLPQGPEAGETRGLLSGTALEEQAEDTATHATQCQQQGSSSPRSSQIDIGNVSLGPCVMGLPVQSEALASGVLSRGPIQPQLSWTSDVAQVPSASLRSTSPAPARPAHAGHVTGVTGSLVQQEIASFRGSGIDEQWSSNDAPGAAGSAGPPRHASPADVRAGDDTSKLAGHADLAEMRNIAGASLADVENREGASQGAGSAQLMEQRLLNVEGASSTEVPKASKALRSEPGMPEPANPGLLQEEPLARRPESSAGHHISEIASGNVSVGPFMGMPSVESPAALSAGVLSRPLQPQHSWSDVPAAQGLSASLQPNSSPAPARPGQPRQMTGTTRSLVQQQWSSNDAPGAAGSARPLRHASPADVRAGDDTSKLAGHADLAEMRNTAGASLADVENREGASQGAGSAQLMEQRLLNVEGASSTEVPTTLHLEPGMPEPANPGLLQEEPLAWRPESSAGHHISEIASSNVSVGPFMGMPSVESPAALSAGVLSRPLQPQHSWSDVPAAQGLSASLQPNSSPSPARPAQTGQMTGTTGSLLQQQWSSNDAPGAAGSAGPPRHASPADVRAGDDTSKLAGHADLAEMRNTAGASLADVENTEGASQGAGSAQLMEQRLLNVEGALSSEVPTTLHLEPGMPEPANPGLLQEEPLAWRPESSAGHHISEIASSNVSVGPFMGMPSVESPAALSAGVLSRPLQPQHSWSDVPAAQGLPPSLQPNSSPVPARPAQPRQMTGTTGSLVQQQWSSNDAPGAAGSAGPPRHASPADVRAGDDTSKLAGHADLAEMRNTAGASLADVENTEGASQGAGSAQLMEQRLLNVEGASSTEVPKASKALRSERGMPEPANPGLLQKEPLARRPESSAGHHISEIASSNVSVGPFMGMPSVESPAALSAGVLSRPLQPQHSWSDVPAAQGLSASLQPNSSPVPARPAQPGQMTGTTGSLVQQQWSSHDAPGAAGSAGPPRRANPADVRAGDDTSKLAGHADLAEMRNTAGASLADVENTEGASQGAGSAQYWGPLIQANYQVFVEA